MRIKKKYLLIQVKYSDLVKDENISKYFLGFSGELYLTPGEIDHFDSQLIDRVKSFAEKNRLSLRLHAPIVEIDYSQVKNILSHMQHLYKKVIEFCEILNIDSVVAHAEFNYSIDFPIDKQLENATVLWGGLSKSFIASNITLNIENHYEIKPDHLLKLMEKINSPNFFMCVDIGHFNAFSNLGIKECMERYPAGSVKEVHLADNKGDGDTHLPLGYGNIDFIGFFETFEKRIESCTFVLEPNNIEEAKLSLSFLRKAGLIE